MIWQNGYVLGAKGNTIKILRNPQGINPSWNQLIEFLYHDDTDKIPYDDQSFVCADFAQRLQNNAELAGWICGYVILDLEPANSPYFWAPEGLHAINVFRTTDRGLIYIDDTGTKNGERGPGSPSRNTKIVDNLALGQGYLPKELSFLVNGDGTLDNRTGPGLSYDDAGRVNSIDIVWP